MSQILIGTSGFNYKDWKGLFYPQKLPERQWLAYYAQHFFTVELNATFYRDMPKSTYELWYRNTPDNFRFAIKGSRQITQYQRLHEVDELVQKFSENVIALKEKLAVVLWQFPPSFSLRPDDAVENRARLEHFLSILPQGIRYAFEFRHISWFTEDTAALLDHYGASMVITDSPRFPSKELPGQQFVYIRFHGPNKLYASRYTPEQMAQWAQKIRTWANTRDVFVYFNNDFFGYAIENAHELEAFIAGAAAV
jgi:uncharacterized protein YecE (DUF72 family)